MARSRSSHQQKDLKDRQRYYRTALGRSPEPTVEDDLFEADATDVESARTTAVRDYRPLTYPSERSSAITEYLKEHWLEIVLVAVLGFLFTQLFTLNREVGEMKSRQEDSRRQQEKLETQLDRINDKLNATRPSETTTAPSAPSARSSPSP